MKNDFKQDWKNCYDNFELWWERRNTDPLIGDFRVKEPSDNWTGLPVPIDHRVKWTDIEYTINQAEDQMQHMLFEGPLFPHYSPSLGPGSLALFLGCNPLFSETTVWYEPCCDDIHEAHATLDQDNYWYKWTKEALTRAMQRSNDRYPCAIPDMIEGLDCAAEMLGTEKLLFALVEHPKEVHRFLREITDCYYQAFDELYDIISPEHNGNAFMAFMILGRGKTSKFQSDISAMLSPSMFDEFVIPYLTEHTQAVDYSLYHLDGPSAIVHLDSLLKVESLNAIQWVPGDGSAPHWDERWYPLYDKILSAGKGLQIGMDRAHLDGFLKRFQSKGLYLLVW